MNSKGGETSDDIEASGSGELNDDDQEAQEYLRALEKAKALSIETYKQEQKKKGFTQSVPDGRPPIPNRLSHPKLKKSLSNNEGIADLISFSSPPSEKEAEQQQSSEHFKTKINLLYASSSTTSSSSLPSTPLTPNPQRLPSSYSQDGRGTFNQVSMNPSLYGNTRMITKPVHPFLLPGAPSIPRASSVPSPPITLDQSQHRPGASALVPFPIPRPSLSSQRSSSPLRDPSALKDQTKTQPSSTNRQRSVSTDLSNHPPQRSIGIRKYSQPANKKSGDLIDLGCISPNQEKSVLDTFDPLLVLKTREEEEVAQVEEPHSPLNSSYYATYDPFEYMSAVSNRSNASDSNSGYEATYGMVSAYGVLGGDGQEEQEKPPLPPRRTSVSPAKGNGDGERTWKRQKSMKRRSRLFEDLRIEKREMGCPDKEVKAFCKMVCELRDDFHAFDFVTNPGMVISPTLKQKLDQDIDIKVIVYTDHSSTPISLTPNINCTLETIVVNIMDHLNGKVKERNPDAWVLQILNKIEYLPPDTCLKDYEHVHSCLKYDRDVQLKLLHQDDVLRPFQRTPQDDEDDVQLNPSSLISKEFSSIDHDQLNILLETLEKEATRLLSSSRDGDTSTLHANGMIQAVKAVSAVMGYLETMELTKAVDGLKSACLNGDTTLPEDWEEPRYAEIIDDDGDSNYSVVQIQRQKSESLRLHHAVLFHIEKVMDAVQALLEMYSRSHHVNFSVSLNGKSQQKECKPVYDVMDNVLVEILTVNAVPMTWQYEEYRVEAYVYYGSCPSCTPIYTRHHKLTHKVKQRLEFNQLLQFDSMFIRTLHRESRLVLTLQGFKREKEDRSTGQRSILVKEDIGWASLQLFDFERNMAQGPYLLKIWPEEADKMPGPAPAIDTKPPDDNKSPSIFIMLPQYNFDIIFPEPVKEEYICKDFDDLDNNTQQLLLDISERNIMTRIPTEEKEVMWEKRHYLHQHPSALPKVLLAAHSWDWACLAGLHSMINSWKPLPPVDALQLLWPCFPDVEVRRVAVECLKDLTSDELVDLLPQLVSALKHDTWAPSALAKFLLERALSSLRLAHSLYWTLKHAIPQKVHGQDTNPVTWLYRRRLYMMLQSLKYLCGQKLKEELKAEDALVEQLDRVAVAVKKSKDSMRSSVMTTELERVQELLSNKPTSLPLDIAIQIRAVDAPKCSFFHSNTLPLKLYFKNSLNETELVPAIYKVGDDLRQDILVLQLIRAMDKLWLREGMDLKMVTFQCVATGDRRGLLELVSSAQTLCQIQTGLTGSFNDSAITEWLVKHNPSTLDYQKAVANFTASCAGYCVATYVLGVCDRHNDNIMVKTSGHMFHIDFGKFLGNAEKFGGFKRDRSPFTLTKDMVYVINGGEKCSEQFQEFVDMCCQAYNILRDNTQYILNLFALMVSSGIPGVAKDALTYVENALLPDHSAAEASAIFARKIEESLKCWFTQLNFFIHSLAQRRFSNDESDEVFSFVPNVYSKNTDGRIKEVSVAGYQKRYSRSNEGKHYLYIIQVFREKEHQPSYLFRTYREFLEFHQKLCWLFPLAKHYSLPRGVSIGRSNVKSVAEKRKQEIERFLKSLFQMAEEIAHSDVVYTFLHPLLRDQEDASVHLPKLKESTKQHRRRSSYGKIKGKLKLQIQYRLESLQVMVHHAQDLAILDSHGTHPSTYVKVYLRPDPNRSTKRKTKVVRKNANPTFMELLEYRCPLETIQNRELEATVWAHDHMQENEFLGSVSIKLSELDLHKGTIEWYRLGNYCR